MPNQDPNQDVDTFVQESLRGLLKEPLKRNSPDSWSNGALTLRRGHSCWTAVWYGWHPPYTSSAGMSPEAAVLAIIKVNPLLAADWPVGQPIEDTPFWQVGQVAYIPGGPCKAVFEVPKGTPKAGMVAELQRLFQLEVNQKIREHQAAAEAAQRTIEEAGQAIEALQTWAAGTLASKAPALEQV